MIDRTRATKTRDPTTRLSAGNKSVERSRQSPALNSTLAAVAFQDHLSRQLSLTTPIRPRPLPGCQRCGKTTSRDQRLVGGRGRHHGDRRGQTGGREEDYVLDVRPPSPTLAQRLGLIEAPAQLLTEGEWVAVKERSCARQDSRLPCPICHGEFGLREQVLLSCSHVFHLVCLRSFEKFSRKKICPLCRCQSYQSRVIFEGVQCHRAKCATRIQAAWRGYVARKWYRKFRERVPPNDPKLRRRYFEDKLSALTERVVQSCVAKESDVDMVLAQADMAVARSRQAMKTLETRCSLFSPAHWDSLRSKVTEQDLQSTECPVCLCPLVPPATPPHSSVALLSCGHLLHSTCIQSLEGYCMMGGARQCPLCRTSYQRQPLL